MPRKKKHSKADVMECVLAFAAGTIDKPYQTKEDLLFAIEDADNTNTLNCGEQEWTTKDVLEAVTKFSDEDFRQFRRSFVGILRNNEISDQLGTVFYERFQKLYPDEHIHLENFEFLDKDFYRLDIHFGGQGHELEFEGTIDELVEGLSEVMQDSLKEKTSCPFCKLEDIRHHWYERTFCECGAEIVREINKIKRGRRWIGEVEQKVKNNPEYISVGKGKSGYGLWFKKPNLDMVLCGSLKERQIKFANYLRRRQTDAGELPSEYIHAASNKSMLDSYRFCAGCGGEIYTEADQNSALMESTSMDSAFNMMFEIGQGHGHEPD